ncbi:DnaB-like helicase C-terminal domain-containing protein [uncultured Draconibacterium sp.]|uniref:DnaB-like helicase C-terminal domain-containing protein n=1 Tax=uncultured Draconibacterium sp. TaxID=1573823 RepID=UPI003260ABD1
MSEYKSINDLIKSSHSFAKTSYGTGIKEFSKLSIEFSPGQVVLVGSRPAVGRTMFLLFLYHYFWKSNGLPQAYISNEECEEKLLHKLIATTTGITINNIIEKFGSPEFPYSDIYLSKDNLLMFSQSSWEELREEIMWLIKEKGIKFFYLDKIQGLQTDETFRNRDQQLGFIAREIKKIAVQNEVVFFLGSSLSRSVERREGKHPYLSDIRESGALEDFCDTIFLIHRPEVYGITEDECGNSLLGIAEILVKKNKHGRTGELTFRFNNQIPRFEEIKENKQLNFTDRFNNQTGNNTDNDTPF